MMLLAHNTCSIDPAATPLRSDSAEQEIRALFNSDPDLTANEKQRLEELIAFCKTNQVPLAVLLPTIDVLTNEIKIAPKDSDKTKLLLQLMGYATLWNLKNRAEALQEGFLLEEIKNYSTETLTYVEHWNIRPEVSSFSGANANIAQYDVKRNTITFNALDKFPPISHPMFQYIFLHEMFHAFQDAHQTQGSIAQVEDEAYLVSTAAVALIGGPLCTSQENCREQLHTWLEAFAGAKEEWRKIPTFIALDKLAPEWKQANILMQAANLWRVSAQILGRTDEAKEADVAFKKYLSITYGDPPILYSAQTVFSLDISPSQLDEKIAEMEAWLRKNPMPHQCKENFDAQIIENYMVFQSELVFLYYRQGKIAKAQAFFAENIFPLMKQYPRLKWFAFDGILRRK